jgi:hypothetical protein
MFGIFTIEGIMLKNKDLTLEDIIRQLDQLDDIKES